MNLHFEGKVTPLRFPCEPNQSWLFTGSGEDNDLPVLSAHLLLWLDSWAVFVIMTANLYFEGISPLATFTIHMLREDNDSPGDAALA